jgi:hypothetical protein
MRTVFDPVSPLCGSEASPAGDLKKPQVSANPVPSEGTHELRPPTAGMSHAKRMAGRSMAVLVVATSLLSPAAPAQAGMPGPCTEPPPSPLVVNVKDKGAKGDGRTDDTEAIQAAIDAVKGTKGTVLVPDGTYLVEVADKKKQLKLKDDMTLKLRVARR